MEKKLSDYILLLEKLIIATISSNNEQSISIKNRIISLINILTSKGIPPQEIENVLTLNEPYDNDLEELKSNFHFERLPSSLVKDIYMQFNDEQIMDKMKNLFINKHKEFEMNGIKIGEDYKFEWIKNDIIILNKTIIFKVNLR